MRKLKLKSFTCHQLRFLLRQVLIDHTWSCLILTTVNILH